MKWLEATAIVLIPCAFLGLFVAFISYLVVHDVLPGWAPAVIIGVLIFVCCVVAVHDVLED